MVMYLSHDTYLFLVSPRVHNIIIMNSWCHLSLNMYVYTQVEDLQIDGRIPRFPLCFELYEVSTDKVFIFIVSSTHTYVLISCTRICSYV